MFAHGVEMSLTTPGVDEDVVAYSGKRGGGEGGRREGEKEEYLGEGEEGEERMV